MPRSKHSPTHYPAGTPAPRGVAQASCGKFFSLSQEAFSSGAEMFATAEEAGRTDDQHAAFMKLHHPDARARRPWIERTKVA